MEKNTYNKPRPPVIAIMGHIDHGKSSLLDYIRRTNIVDKEVGGITQILSAYEVEHTTKEGQAGKITFLDTPGHESFRAIRERGVEVADVAILVVSGEDGVKPQTIEAFEHIKKSNIPFVVAITKIDKENSSVDRTKQSLAEHEIYVEGYGGEISWVAISSKSGEGIPELLDLIVLAAELEEISGNPDLPGTGIVIEAGIDSRKGMGATLIVKDGTIKQGQFIVSGSSFAPVRIMENFLGKPIKEATFSSPIKILGFNKLPVVGDGFLVVDTKKEAESLVASGNSNTPAPQPNSITNESAEPETPRILVPIIIKADATGTLDAIRFEMEKMKTDKVELVLKNAAVGPITEGDINNTASIANATLIGFNTKTDVRAKLAAERLNVTIVDFDIIYKLVEYLKDTVTKHTPVISVEEPTGTAKILRVFSKNRDKQVIGGKVQDGSLQVGKEVVILRRDIEIGRGRIRELQQQKLKTENVQKGSEFGALVEAKKEIVEGDKIQCIQVVTK